MAFLKKVFVFNGIDEFHGSSRIKEWRKYTCGKSLMRWCFEAW